MAHSSVKMSALDQPDLLKRVVDFKMKFYPRSWAQYPEAKRGTLRLIPPAYRFASLQADYESMKGMLFGKIPSFDDVMESIRQLETEINAD